MAKVNRMASPETEEIIRQNELIISLLGRIAFKNDELRELIQKGSKEPEEILVAYNLCDGQTPITDIAKKAGIAKPSLTVAIEKWEGLGVVFKKMRGAEVLPLKLFEVK
jgi:DNA-binding MarR family transcriptional regulator